MKRSRYFYFPLVILLVTIVFIVSALTTTGRIPAATRAARLLPLGIGSLLVILTSVELFRELRKKPTKESPAEETAAAPRNVKLELETAAWIVGYLVLLYVTGVLLSTFLFPAAYLKLHNVGWVRSILIGLGCAVFCYVLFDLALQMRLYQGAVPIPLYRFLP